MDNMDRALDEIIANMWSMSADELDSHIERVLASPEGKLVKQFNDETIEAIKDLKVCSGR